MTHQLTIDSKNLFYRKNLSHGYYEVVDSISGQVLAVQKDYNENFRLGMFGEMIQATIDGKEVYFQKGINPENYKPPVLSYSKPIADLILQEVTEGATLKKACEKFGIQYSTVMKWAKKVQDFGEALDEARRLSAEMVHDEVMDEAKEMLKGNMSKGELESKRAALDLMKWSAEKRDPNRFGNKQEKSAPGAVQIVIQTGISRETVVEVKENDSETSK